MAGSSARTSISLEPAIYQAALRRAAALGFKKSFSAYVEYLIERDLREATPGNVVRYEALPHTRESKIAESFPGKILIPPQGPVFARPPRKRGPKQKKKT